MKQPVALDAVTAADSPCLAGRGQTSVLAGSLMGPPSEIL